MSGMILYPTDDERIILKMARARELIAYVEAGFHCSIPRDSTLEVLWFSKLKIDKLVLYNGLKINETVLG